jgi:hypothetical protein
MTRNGVSRLSPYFILLFLLAIHVAGTAQSNQDVVRSSLVFRGTVVRLQSSTLQTVAAVPNTIVVKVDSVLRTTDPLNDYTGKEITVYVRDSSALKVGDKAVFYTQGWMMEDSIAVRELNHTKLNAAGAFDQAALKIITTAVQAEGNKLIQQRTSEANLVIEGEVISTERVDILPATAGDGSPSVQMVFSEHNPLLKKAVIQVSKAYPDSAGNIPQVKTVTIIYPTSQDIAWIGAPKFKVGDAGLFVLRKAQSNLELKEFLEDVRGRIEGLEKNYIGPNPLDFHPKSEIERIRLLIKPVTLQPNP